MTNTYYLLPQSDDLIRDGEGVIYQPRIKKRIHEFSTGRGLQYRVGGYNPPYAIDKALKWGR